MAGDMYSAEGNPSQDWFDQFHPDQLGPQTAGGWGGGPADGGGEQGGGGAPVRQPDWLLNGDEGPGPWGNPPANGGDTPTPPWWQDPNFGAPPTPYASQPWTGGQAPTFTKGGPAPTYTGPGAAPVFTAPTGVDEQNDPGYAFRLAQGNQALNRGFAASGQLLSGGTAKALARYNQDYASNEFGKVYDRALQNFGAQNQTFQNNQGAALNTFGAANTTYQNDQSANQQDFNNQNTNYQTRYGTYLGENTRTLSDWLQNVTAKRNAESDYWTRLKGVSDTGYDASRQGQSA